jgi:fatty acid desaturase
VNKAEYQAIRDHLSFERSYRVTALVLLANLALFALGLALATSGSALGYLASQVVFALVFFQHFAILHESGHESASSAHWLNTLTGHYASLFCFLPYFPWKYIHIEHHTWTGNLERDPTLKAIRDYRETAHVKNWVLQLAWRTWVPLLAFVQHTVLWSYPLMMLKMGRLWGGRLLASIGSVALLPVAYVGLYLALPGWFNPANFGLAVVFYLVLVELINFPHHLGTELFIEGGAKGAKLPLWEQARTTRSCYYPRVLSTLLLNFNFHIEHHLFPNLPWHQLRKARARVRPALGDEYQECVGIAWNLENRCKDACDVFLPHPQDIHRQTTGSGISPVVAES